MEFQYSRSAGAQNGTSNVPANMGSNGLGSTMTMSGIKKDESGEAYNDPFQMVPTAGKMLQQMSSTFLSVTSTEGST